LIDDTLDSLGLGLRYSALMKSDAVKVREEVMDENEERGDKNSDSFNEDRE